MGRFEIESFHRFLSPKLAERVLDQSREAYSIPGLRHLGECGGLESKESLEFLIALYFRSKDELRNALDQRDCDRKFIDARSPYVKIAGLEDSDGRVVFGPRKKNFFRPGGKTIAPLPDFLKGPHVTLFGPPDTEKMAINAMNSFHRTWKDEPPIIAKLANDLGACPFWGADDEDSKTPLRSDLQNACRNLASCIDGTLSFQDGGKDYRLAQDRLAFPIKRIPGIAIPCNFLFLDRNPIPLHLYDFALHLFHHRRNPRALVFYVPKLENEEEALYLKNMIASAEELISKIDSSYIRGSVRLLVVLENPRAIVRIQEIIDFLHPYFAGASLGWHDYLASTARLMRENSNYRIPVKADPYIVIKHIHASHRLLSEVVGSRGGIAIGGMYGILPLAGDDQSFQVALSGFYKDVLTQLKRDLTGFWVAHPDFVRVGLALVQGWKLFRSGDRAPLRELITETLGGKFRQDLLKFLESPDGQGIDPESPEFLDALVVTNIKESDFIANNHPDEIRYNVFQSLQYLADWLSGNGCVALPTTVENVPVRVMDDLATAERSRWEVWHEVRHGRFSLTDLIQIVEEEMNFIRRDLSTSQKTVQVKWSDRTARWYPVAKQIFLKLVTDKEPAEFASELLLPFTLPEVRESPAPLDWVVSRDPQLLRLEKRAADYAKAFEICGNHHFAEAYASSPIDDLSALREIVFSLSKDEIVSAAKFHGDFGQNKKTLDKSASHEQAKIQEGPDLGELRKLGSEYLKKFGFKFLVSAQGKSSRELLKILQSRFSNSESEEIKNARAALWEISQKRLSLYSKGLHDRLDRLRAESGVRSASIAVSRGDKIQALTLGAEKSTSLFQIASLSKPIAAAFALEYFRDRKIGLETTVNSLFANSGSQFRLKGEWSESVTLMHLLNHTALDFHYVPAHSKELVLSQVRVINEPGKIFQYSGGGFVVLEHLLECLTGKSIAEILRGFFEIPANVARATGFLDSGQAVKGLEFPTLAAGIWATPESVLRFLQNLTRAHQGKSSNISHDTAAEMLFAQNLGSVEFMGCKMGLGIFVAEAGQNRLLVHQGANDGFRAIFIHVVNGPDQGKGFVVLANGDNRAVPMIAKMSQEILKELQVEGVDWSRIPEQSDTRNWSQENIVNKIYKSQIFDVLEADLPESILKKGPLDTSSEKNLVIGAKIISVSNQKFARAENLFSPFEPVFDPKLFGRQGKIMDSWESARHNPLECDSLVFELKSPRGFRFVSFSTRFHDGNQPEKAGIQAWSGQDWIEILPATPLSGHSMKVVDLGSTVGPWSKFRVQIFPDGGLSRLGFFEDLPRGLSLGSTRFDDPIPKVKKPLHLPWNEKAAGAWVSKVSNEHYGPASQVISPMPALNMFDGFESARSRKPGHFEEIEIEFDHPRALRKVVFDFKFFVNNNPRFVSLEGASGGAWKTLIEKTFVKPFAGNFKEFSLSGSENFKSVRIRIYPDGGINRVFFSD